jgi:hypothetical protein
MEKFYKAIGKTFIFLIGALLMGFPIVWFCMIALNVAGSSIKTGIKPATDSKAV